MHDILSDMLEVTERAEPKTYRVYSTSAIRVAKDRAWPTFSKERIRRGVRVKAIAIGKGGKNIPVDRVDYDYVFGYAVGLDMTRRDLQRAARAKGRPWDMAKAFDHSAPCSAITPEFYAGNISRGKIELKVNGEVRQSGDVGDMILKIPQMVHTLSTLVELFPGDLIFTGTPAGVGPVVKGDVIEATVAGLEPLIITIGAA